MDSKNPTPNPGDSAPEPLIRTMQKDIEKLSQGPDLSSPSMPLPQRPSAPAPTPAAPVPPSDLGTPPPDLPTLDSDTPLTPESISPDLFGDTDTTSVPAPDNIPMPNTQEEGDDIKRMVEDRIKHEDEIGQRVAEREKSGIENRISSNLDDSAPSAGRPLTELEQDQTEQRKEAVQTSGARTDEQERLRRAEEEEKAPKDFEMEMTQGSLSDQKKKVQDLAKKEKKGGALKIIIIILAVVVVLGAAGGALYYWNWPGASDTYSICQANQCVIIDGKGEDQCQNNVDCAPIGPAEPISLIPFDSTYTLQLQAESTDQLSSELQDVSVTAQQQGTIKRILVKIDNDGEVSYMSLSELLSTFGTTLPASGTADDYTLYFYSQPQGRRLGLVIDTTTFNISQSEIEAALRSQEPSLKDSLEPMFLGQNPGLLGSEEFSTNVYKDVSIRYLNFPDPSLTIDYAVVGNKLIITTSKDSMYAAIDAIGGGIVTPPPPPPATEANADEADSKVLTTNSLDKQTGTVYSTLTLTVPTGTFNGTTEISMTSLPASKLDRFIGGFYVISPVEADKEPQKDIEISITYTDEAVSLYKELNPEFTENNLILAYFDNDANAYKPLESSFDKENKTVSGPIAQFYTGGLMIIDKDTNDFLEL